MGQDEHTPMALPSPPVWRQPALLRRLFSSPADLLDDVAAQYGPNVCFGAGPMRVAIIGDPATLRQLLLTKPDNFRWGHKFNVLGFVVGDESMIVSDGADHKRRRSSVQGAFSRRRLNAWIPMIVERTDMAIDDLASAIDGGESETDLYNFGRSLLLEIVVRSLFGERLAERAEEIGGLFQRPQKYLESPAIKQIPHPFPRTARAGTREDRRALDSMVAEEIKVLRSADAEGPVDPLDVLASLVAESELSDSEITDQVVTLMGAGYDTTAASLAWMIWCVSLCDGLWERLRDEADAVLGPVGSSAVPDNDSLMALDLARRTMRETTRLHPAGVISPREAATDMVVNGYEIKQGTLILWSAHLAGRSAEAWTDPLTFDPDRFSGLSDDQRAVADAAWVPFGGGPRNCIGFALAQMELTLIISRMAQRLDIVALRRTIPRPVGMVVNRPAGGTPMRVAARV